MLQKKLKLKLLLKLALRKWLNLERMFHWDELADVCLFVSHNQKVQV